MGRWKSWAMLRYLHRSATPTHTYASQMLTHGNYVIPAHAKLPADLLATFKRLPPEVLQALAEQGHPLDVELLS